jgi:HEAT repeat protein
VASSLATVGGEDARDALIAALADEDARVRTAVARALGEFRDDPAVARALREIPGTEPAYGTIAAAVLSLARIRAEDARETALRALETPSYREQVRRAGLEALGELGDPADAPRLREWTAYGKPPRARTAAVDALVALDVEGQAREETVATLLELVDDPYIWVREAAMRGLGKLRAEEAIPALRRASNVEPDSRLRRQARRSLREIRSGTGGGEDLESLEAEVERLRQELRDQAERIRTLEQGGR